jgi:hypothetical protein
MMLGAGFPVEAQNPSAPPDALAFLNEFQALTINPPRRDEYSVYNQLKGNGTETNPVRTSSRPPYKLGDEDTFWVFDSERKSYYQVRARLVALTDNAYWFLDVGYAINVPSLQRAAQLFEERILTTNRKFFGQEWNPGVDGDPRMVILNTPLRGGVIGFYSSEDEQLRSINPKSNEREMMYVMGKPENTDSYLSLLAHEYQHMIHWRNQPNQDVWLNEGASVLAQTLNGFSSSGYENSFFSRPGTQLNGWTCLSCSVGRQYGAGYVWMAYLQDIYGAEIVRDLITNGKNLTGFNAVDYALSTNVQAAPDSQQVFKNWIMANYLNRTTGDKLYNFSKITTRNSAATQPINQLPATRSGNTAQYSAQYFRVTAGDGGFTLDFEGSPTAFLYNTKPASEQMAWWTNKGETSSATLTRDLDLTKVSNKATLKYKIWHDIEAQYDFLYLQVSEDGGKTWQILPGRSTVTNIASGRNYGPGYTGRSTRNQPDMTDSEAITAEWVQEEVDLSKYAGKKIKVRFQYLTDEGYNRQGAVLDDFEVPKIGWSDNVESGENGWETAGFIRSGSLIPQKYFVRTLRLDGACAARDTTDLSKADNGQSCIQDMELDLNNKGQLRLPYSEALVVVAPYATKTIVPAPFTLKFSN